MRNTLDSSMSLQTDAAKCFKLQKDFSCDTSLALCYIAAIDWGDMSRLQMDPVTSTPNGEESPHTRRLVLLGCAMAIVLFIVAVGVLYSGWFGHENPNALIVVQGDPSIADAFVSVRP